MITHTVFDAAFISGISGSKVAEAWASQVQIQGGAAPSQTTIDALQTFYDSIRSAGISSKITAVNCVAPDSLTAARVPLIARAGYAIWVNHNFVSGDLTTSGLAGDGSTKYLDTGIIPNTATGLSLNSAGISLMVVTNPGTGNTIDMGVGGPENSSEFALHINATSATLAFQCWRFINSGQDWIGPAISASYTGFISGSRTASNALAAYSANTSSPTLTTVGTGTGTQTGAIISTYPMLCWAYNAVGSATLFSPKRLSFLAVHSGLTSGETQSLYNAVATMRTSLGGGNP